VHARRHGDRGAVAFVLNAQRRYWQLPLSQLFPPGQLATHVPVLPVQHPELHGCPGTEHAFVHWKLAPQVLWGGQSPPPAHPQTPAGPQMLPPGAFVQSLWPLQPQTPSALHFGPFGDVAQLTQACPDRPQLCGSVFPAQLPPPQQKPVPQVPSPLPPQLL
jgi:hypothetical protein